jgi:hypothetical protein
VFSEADMAGGRIAAQQAITGSKQLAKDAVAQSPM